MKLAYFCNYLNLHQVTLADELYKLLGNEFVFVSTVPLKLEFSKGGEDYSQTRLYCLRAFESESNRREALRLAEEADVCVFGAQTMEYELQRARTSKGLAFEGSERWLKRGWLNLFSPRLLWWLWHYHTKFRKLPWYRIGSSAFTAIDDFKLHCYRGREYKWGYFTKVDESFDVEASIQDASTSENTPLMWCGRFLTLKHPELPVLLAAKLKTLGYKIVINIYGDEGNAAKHDGIFPRRKLEDLIEQLGVKDCVKLMGSRPNNEILAAMRSHSIFLFTSNRYEGWGAVANEAMSNGCCLVGSDQIGSVPYLIKDGENGCIFKTGDLDSLCEKVKYLLDYPEVRKKMAIKAHHDMVSLWSPEKAAKNLVALIDDLMSGTEVSIKEGPCSKAELIRI